MCITPNKVWIERGPTWEEITVPCRLCWRCRSNRVSDYVGRALCEASTSDWTCTLTLTYATPDPSAEFPNAHKVLTPIHFQRFIRSLRKRGHKIRYIVAGEYGELKGRSHFHCVLFGTFPDDIHERPDWPQQRRFHMDEWPHGHVFCDWNVDDRSMRYVCKYILKYEGTQSWFSLSKKPALGAGFFKKKARELIESGVLPSGFEYMPPGGQRNRPYLLSGAARRDYVLAVVRGWLKRRDLDVRRLSEWFRKSLAKYERAIQAARIAASEINVAIFMQSFKDELDRRRPRLETVLRGLMRDIHPDSQEGQEHGAQKWKGFTWPDGTRAFASGDAGPVDTDTDPAAFARYAVAPQSCDCGEGEKGCIQGDAGPSPYGRHALGYAPVGYCSFCGGRSAGPAPRRSDAKPVKPRQRIEPARKALQASS